LHFEFTSASCNSVICQNGNLKQVVGLLSKLGRGDSCINNLLPVVLKLVPAVSACTAYPLMPFKLPAAVCRSSSVGVGSTFTYQEGWKSVLINR
jgi:hypothetical protein